MSDLVRVLSSFRPIVRMRTVRGEPLTVGERQVVPLARQVVVGLGRPGGPLAFGWARARPVALLDTWRGQTRRIPIVDPTRTAVMAMAATLLALALATRFVSSRRQRGL
jgi:hypothetical protein